jgi:hypothetical protein
MPDDERIVKQGEHDIGVDKASKKRQDIFDTQPEMKGVMGLDENKSAETKEMTKDVLPEIKSAVDDVPADKAWVEEKEGTIAPLANAGTTEEPIADDQNKRFAKRDVEGFDDATLVTGQKTKAHKTKSGL